MNSLYQQDLAYVHASAFGELARGAAPEIVRRLRSANVGVQRVVDIGCGAGQLSRALVDAGFAVTGIDPSADLLTIASEHVPEASFVQGLAYEVELPASQAVIALGEPLTYHDQLETADKLLLNFFRRVSTVIPAGGLLIFDVIGLGEPALGGRSWRTGDDWAVLVETSEDQSARSLVRTIETFRSVGDLYRRSRETHKVKLFDVPALCDQLRSCGFSIETANSYGAQPLGPRRQAVFATRTDAINPGN
jgi:SAM-dependent methyltransferase